MAAIPKGSFGWVARSTYPSGGKRKRKSSQWKDGLVGVCPPSARDPAATDDHIILIKYSSLTWSNRSLRRVEFHGSAAARKRGHCCRGARMIVTDFHCRFEFHRRICKSNPVATVNRELVTFERKFVPNDYAIGIRFEFDDVQRLRRCNTQAFALADGIKLDAFMPAD